MDHHAQIILCLGFMPFLDIKGSPDQFLWRLFRPEVMKLLAGRSYFKDLIVPMITNIGIRFRLQDRKTLVCWMGDNTNNWFVCHVWGIGIIWETWLLKNHTKSLEIISLLNLKHPLFLFCLKLGLNQNVPGNTIGLIICRMISLTFTNLSLKLYFCEWHFFHSINPNSARSRFRF